MAFQQELVGMPAEDAFGPQHICGKILQVKRQKLAGPAIDGGCKDVNVSRIGQCKARFCDR